MNDSRELYLELFELAREQVKTAGLDKALPWLAGAGLLTAGAGIPLAYRAGRDAEEDEDMSRRGLAFGAGALSGLVAPKLIGNLKNLVGLEALPGDSPEDTDFTEI